MCADAILKPCTADAPAALGASDISNTVQNNYRTICRASSIILYQIANKCDQSAHCELVHTSLASSRQKTRVEEAQAMTEPAKRMPEWLITDLLVIVVSLAIISIWIWIGP
jgi:hypothetical protein